MTEPTLDDELNALRAHASLLGRGRSGFEPITPPQRMVIVLALEKGLADKTDLLRHRVLAKLFPHGLTKAVESTNDLSKAQAMALIDWLYGGAEINASTPLSPKAQSALGQLKTQCYLDEGQLSLFQ